MQAAQPFPNITAACRSRSEMLRDVLRGLRRNPRAITCKYFYDARGCELFEQICETDDYYVTRTELEIMRRHSGEMGRMLGARATIIELGCGNCRKTQMLLDQVEAPAAFIPVEINRTSLDQATRVLAARFPALTIRPVCADFTQRFSVPRLRSGAGRRIVYFPGSTIGNLAPRHAQRLLQRMATLCRQWGGMLIGVDLKKDRNLLEQAYNDRDGRTAAFNLNLLERLNRDLGANFRSNDFRHQAHFNETHGRIEMHLVSRCRQTACIAGHCFQLAAGDSIHTECSYKYRIDEFCRHAAAAGWKMQRTWTYDRQYFCVMYFVAG